jgi:hypothetical protein
MTWRAARVSDQCILVGCLVEDDVTHWWRMTRDTLRIGGVLMSSLCESVGRLWVEPGCGYVWDGSQRTDDNEQFT